MGVRIIGAEELTADLGEVGELLQDAELITGELASLMRKHVHVRTGYLRSTIYSKGAFAGADAPYAGIEEQRGGDHAYATKAAQDFNMEKYADQIWEPLD